MQKNGKKIKIKLYFAEKLYTYYYEWLHSN